MSRRRSRAWRRLPCARLSSSPIAPLPVKLCPRLGSFIDDSETDVLTHLDFPSQHRTRIHSTNSLERLNKEVKRRADVVGIFPNEGSIIRLIGAVLLEANDEWQTQNRYMQTEPMAELIATGSKPETIQISTAAA